MVERSILSFIESAEVPIILCNKLNEIQYLNAAFEKEFQLLNDECFGKKLFNYLKKTDNQDTRKYLIVKNETESIEVKCVFNNSEYGNWILLKRNSIKDYQLKLEAIINAAVDGIIIINKKGIIEEINPAGAKVFGYTKEEVVGENVRMLMPQPHHSKHNQYISNYVNTGVKKIIGVGREVWGKKKNGDLFPFKLGISEVKLNDRIIFAGIIHDLSDRVRAEETAVALKKEQQLNELKSRFVSLASHEFRTPLSTIASSLSLIESYEAPEYIEKRNKHINRIYSNIQSLTNILDDFLSISKLEEGKVENIPVSFNLKKFIEEVIEEVKVLDKENHNFVFDYKGEELVELDKKLLNNILLNLLSNAIKYSNKQTNIAISAKVSSKISIIVKDEGIGIPAIEQNQLFERFFRAKNVSNIQGTGLGLNIVKKYTELMNGSISFISKENEGSTFTLKFASLPKN